MSIPSKTEAYRFAESSFFRSYNDVDFYVEDEAFEFFYLALFKRTFSAVKIRQIFPLGGKEKCLDHARCNRGSLKRSVYLLDLDYDDLLDCQDKLDGVFYLDEYSIENYLVDHAGFVSYFMTVRPRLRFKDVEELVKVDTLIQEFVSNYKELYAHLFLAHKHALPDIRTFSSPLERFCVKSRLIECCPLKASAYQAKILNCLSKLQPDLDLEPELEGAREIFSEGRRRCPGKHILRALLDEVGKCLRVTTKVSLDSAMVIIAKDCDLVELESVFANIKNYLAQQDDGDND